MGQSEIPIAWAPWPELRLAGWRDTCETLHRWMQVVGKVRLGLTPSLNHTWHVPLYLSARGLSTSPIPSGDGSFEMAFDLVSHELRIETSDGRREVLPLVSRSVASFYAEVLAQLRSLDIAPPIWTHPVEIEDPVPFEEDHRHAVYVPEEANRFFRVVSHVDLALKRFMGRFQGKQSPSHFFWGSFDLAQSRFSGRRAPLPPGADWLRRECYAHEVMSFGFWPGLEGVTDAAFYAYAAPEPPGFPEAVVKPAAAAYHGRLNEFLLPYEAVRRASAPAEEILAFFQSVYEAGATLGRWDRAVLDRFEPPPPVHKHPPEASWLAESH